MKPEPLKGKIWYIDEIHSKPTGKFNTKVVPLKDICLAVEWLKQHRLCSICHEIYGKCKCGGLPVVWFLDVEEAFEDVIKEKV